MKNARMVPLDLLTSREVLSRFPYKINRAVSTQNITYCMHRSVTDTPSFYKLIGERGGKWWLEVERRDIGSSIKGKGEGEETEGNLPY